MASFSPSLCRADSEAGIVIESGVDAITAARSAASRLIDLLVDQATGPSLK
jgi:hypothetical protein